VHDEFRKRLGIVFGRWAQQLEALLEEQRPKLRDGEARGLERALVGRAQV
jgi:hypothetical protein